jgi:hypothetical protein
VQRAAWALAIGAKSLPARMEDAAEIIGVLEMSDFPPDLRISFAKIHEAITAEGSFEASVARLSPERTREIAEEIWDLAAEVARREAIENRD